jgi:hypothetical protein
MTRDQVIAAALRGLEVYGPADTPTASDITNCTEALNILLKSWGAKGLNLWTNVDRSLAMVSGTGAYDVGPTAVAPGLTANLPLRIVDAFFRVGTTDTKVQIISRYDYDVIANKSAQGTPSQLFYDPTIPNGKIYLSPVPNSGAGVLHFVSQDPIQDVGASTDNPAIPQEWYQLLKWALMDEIAIEYGCPSTVVQLVAQKAKALRDELTAYVAQVFGGPIEPDAKPRIERA